MANTQVLKREVEKYIRSALEKEHGQRFESRRLVLTTGGDHEFDAVSEDHHVVAAVKSSSIRTATGRNPGGVKSALAELYYLTLVDAPTRLLVLTDPRFHEVVRKEVEMPRRLAHGITLRYVPLPDRLRKKVGRVHAAAAREQRSR